MIKDVAPELLERIRNDFKIKFEENEKIKELYELMASGNATYKEVNEFAIETGRILTIVFANDLSSNVLPDGKMYFNIANRIIPDTVTIVMEERKSCPIMLSPPRNFSILKPRLAIWV